MATLALQKNIIKIPIVHIGRSRTIEVKDTFSGLPMSLYKKTKELRIMQPKSTYSKKETVVKAIVKLNLIIASISLFSMPAINVYGLELKLYAIVGLVVAAVAVYIELSPAFFTGADKKKPTIPQRRQMHYEET